MGLPVGCGAALDANERQEREPWLKEVHRCRSRHDTGDGADPFENAGDQRRARRFCGIDRFGNAELRADDAGGVEAGTHSSCSIECAEEERTAHQQHDGQGRFRADQGVSDTPVSRGSRGPPICVCEVARHIATETTHRGYDAREQRHPRRDGHRQRLHSPVNRHIRQHAAGRRIERQQHRQRPRAKQQSSGGSGRDQHQCFHQLQPHDGRAAAAEGSAQRVLGAARHHLRQRQVREIRARDNHQREHAGKQDEQIRTLVPELRRAQRGRLRGPPAQHVRRLAHDALHDRFLFGEQLLNAGAVTKASKGLNERPIALHVALVNVQWCPEFGVDKCHTKRGGHDADDLVRDAVEMEGPADDVRVPAEAALPHAVTQHDDPRVVAIFGDRERASNERTAAKQREHAG